MLVLQIMASLKGFANLGAQPHAQGYLARANPPATNTMPRVGEYEGNDAFFYPLSSFVMTGNDHDMLPKLFTVKP